MTTTNIRRHNNNPAVITGETINFMNKWKQRFSTDAQAAQMQIIERVTHAHKLMSIDEARSLERMSIMAACLDNARCYSQILAFANMHLDAILHTGTGNLISELMGCIDLQFDEPRLPEIIKAALIRLADQLVVADKKRAGER